MSEMNKQLSRRFTELFTVGDPGRADEVLSRDVVFHGPAGIGDLCGLAEMKRFVAAYHAAFPDAQSTIEDQVAEGSKVVTRWRARGTHRGDLAGIAATGREIDLQGITIERIEDGKIVEVWVARDDLRLLRQLGALPEDPSGS
jgi:steroid delta-isomerase-like uncharacterized protein